MAKKPSKAKTQAATAEDRLRVAKGEVADAEAEVARLANELGACRLQVKAAEAAMAEARSEIESLRATDAAESEIIAELKAELAQRDNVIRSWQKTAEEERRVANQLRERSAATVKGMADAYDTAVAAEDKANQRCGAWCIAFWIAATVAAFCAIGWALT